MSGDADPVLDGWDRAVTTWVDGAHFAAAVAAVVARFGDAPADVEAQLRHVVARCRADVMRALLEREVAADAERPGSVLVLASGGVAGLVLEGIAAALTLDATAIVRPSRDECVLEHLLAHVATVAPEVAAHIVVVEDRDGIPWKTLGAAIVFGSDETIAVVRRSLDPRAARRVGAYGSRRGIAVVTRDATLADPTWATRLADDVLTFRQRGCMSPSWLFVVGGDDSDAQGIIATFGRELAHARGRHLAPGADDRTAQRRASDADILGAIAAGSAPDPRVLHAGDARLTVVALASRAELFDHVAALGSLLQTAVLAASDAEQAELTELLERAGCTRIVAPGDAHRPDPHWPHDGIGRLAPLVS